MMPKHLRSSSHSGRGYGPEMSVPLAAGTAGTGNPMYSTRLAGISTTNNYYPMAAATTTAPAMVPQAQPTYDPYAVQGPVVPVSTPHRASSGAWSAQDDQTLLTARAQGLNWSQIQQSCFPSKTSNACRKRHERLMERKGADDWDSRKYEQLAKEYMTMRKEIWQPLASRTGEKWNVVEAKNLQSAARSAARRERLESGHPLPPGYDDDSGISGIGLTPVDDLDPSSSTSHNQTTTAASSSVYSSRDLSPAALHHSAALQHSYHHHQHQQQQQGQGHLSHHHSGGDSSNSSNHSSPGAASQHSSGSGSSSTASATGYTTAATAAALSAATGMGGLQQQYAHHGHAQHHHYQQQGAVQASYVYAPSHQYNSSVSSTGTSGAAAAAAAGGYGGVGGSAGTSPYLDPTQGQRLPSVDMGIDAIINRPALGGKVNGGA